MTRVNANFLKLTGGYLFPEIHRRTKLSEARHPDLRHIRMGIGDVTLPLPRAVVDAMASAARELGERGTFRGYCEETNGAYDFLRLAISRSYSELGVDIRDDEIFVSDGAKSDCGNIFDIFSGDSTVAVCDPSYPVYVDSAVMAGLAGSMINGRWSGLEYLPLTRENGFSPALPEGEPELIFLCSPNNPTGAAMTRRELIRWVDWAREHGSVILFDAAYEAFITRDDVPHSIFEINGARECAIEFRSFSKTAGFTGVRCAYTIVPAELRRGGVSLRDLWRRRQSTKFNGVGYAVQRAAEAALTPEGRRDIRRNIDYYLENAGIITRALKSAGLPVFGGIDAPYIWCGTPEGMGSWDFFDKLLDIGVVTTPGAGFGPSGEGYVRLTAFGSREDTDEAMWRILNAL